MRQVARQFGSLKFNGTSSYYVNVKSGKILGGLSNFTVAGWTKGLSPGNDPLYTERAATGSDILKVEFNTLSGGGALKFTYRDDAGNTTAKTQSTTQILKGVWTHVAIVRNAGNIYYYLNGVNIGTQTMNVSTSANFTDAGIQSRIAGDAGDGSANFEGNITEVALWSRSLSDTEITQVYANGANTVTGNSEGLWNFTEQTGTTTADTSGNNNTGTITGATWSTDVPGRGRMVVQPHTSSMSFVGSGDVTVTKTAGLNPTSSVSIAAWVKMPNTLGNQMTLLSVQGGSDAYGLEIGGYSKDGCPNLFYWAGGASYPVIQSPTKRVDDQQWHHVVGVKDGTNSQLRFYIDGQLVTQASDSGTINYDASGTNIVLGHKGSNTGRAFIGRTVDVGVWNVPLTTAQVQQLYTNRIIPTGCQLFLPFSDSTGTTATDTSGNGNNGTITGASWSGDVPMVARSTAMDVKCSLNFTSTNLVNITRTTTHETNSITWGARIKLNAVSGNQTIIRKWSSTGVILRVVSGKASVQVANGATRTLSGNTMLQAGVWYHVVGSYNAISGVLNIYLNGVLDGSSTVTAGNIIYDTDATALGNNTGGTEPLNGKLVNARLYGTALAASEVTSWYTGGAIGTTPVGIYLLQEGAGTTAQDTSGNGNTGVITGATFSSDTPSKARKTVGANKVENGAFEFAPPFTAATNADSRFVDGTAAGSASNDLFRWRMSTVGTTAVSFDTTDKISGTYSLKASLLTTGSFIEIYNGKTATAANVLQYGIPVTPGVAYTGTFWMKTNYTSGDSNDGVNVNFVGFGGSGSIISGYNSSYIKTTTAWTKYTVNFTASASDRFIMPRLTLYGHTGAGTLIMSANFDDITLVETTTPTRAQA